MIDYFDPRAEPGRPVEPYELSVDPSGEPIAIGLVANGFPDSEAFLDHVEKALAHEIPSAAFHRYNKHNASAMISEEMLDEVVTDCQAVVAAYGH